MKTRLSLRETRRHPDVPEVVFDAIRNVLPVDDEQVVPTANLWTDLGAEDLDLVEIAVNLARTIKPGGKLGAAVLEDKVIDLKKGWQTVADIIAAVTPKPRRRR